VGVAVVVARERYVFLGETTLPFTSSSNEMPRNLAISSDPFILKSWTGLDSTVLEYVTVILYHTADPRMSECTEADLYPSDIPLSFSIPYEYLVVKSASSFSPHPRRLTPLSSPLTGRSFTQTTSRPWNAQSPPRHILTSCC
jgi:hypothetical protein